MKDRNLPDGGNQFGATDFAVRRNQGESFDERGGSDYAIRWIFGISCWKCHGARTRAASYREDDKAGFDFLEERFEADSEVDAAFTREGRQLQEGDIADCQTVSVLS